MLVRHFQQMSGQLLAGFVGLSFLISLSLIGIYLIFTSIFVCSGENCSSSAWSGLFLVAAGLLIFIFSIFGRYDTKYYLGK